MFLRPTLLAVSLSFLAIPLLAQKVDESAAPVKVVRAFPKLKIERPTVFTTARDGSDRLYVVTQQGKISVIPNDQKVTEAKVFLDISDRVVYKEKENEEGFLGLAFHPKYKENGQFFVHYTSTKAPHLTFISRFRVSKDDPEKADPNSEEELLRFAHPYWNHKGGSAVFGPDGYLYFALGDGGLFNDPHGNGQKLNTLLGKILRIDVDHKDEGKGYAVPKDNPFVGKGDARPEIWAYGLRNPWCISFDKDGTLWCPDVGQDIWEEIDIITKGGNYGWNLREGLHKFGPKGSEPRKDIIEPIWEYNHTIGKSITGGEVYHGKRIPELEGHYIYADYVSGKVWALKYDAKSGKVTANRSIQSETMPYIAVGQDDAGEVYLTDAFGQIWWLEKK